MSSFTVTNNNHTDANPFSIRHRLDHESQPILDHGKTTQAQMDEMGSQHKNVYVGMHLPTLQRRRHPHKRSKRRRKSAKMILSDSSAAQLAQESETVLPPNQQVQFILGADMEGQDSDMEETPTVFTEMEELKMEDGDMVWRETARWIKFEETVEDGGDRWSKPHVATLSLHSLFELRSCLLNGVVQLDMIATDISQIVDLVLDQLINRGHLPSDPDIRERVRTAMLSGHEHQGEKKQRSHRRRDSISHQAVTDATAPPPDSADLSSKKQGSKDKKLGSFRNWYGGKGGENNTHHDDGSFREKKVPYFMKKIPAGAEASNVLIGEVDFLNQRIIAFVRLKDSTILERLTEVPIPTRFLFILLGPCGNLWQYHEIGRSIATLMADEVFHEVAYKAKTRRDLLAGIDEFLDQVTVLPPGEWDNSIRIEPPKNIPTNQKKRLEAHNQPGWAPAPESEHALGPELQRTGTLFGGLVSDIKRRLPHYKSDFIDAWSLQCLASFIFLYFAILTPIVTFGGLLGDATENNLGTMESLFGGAMSGMMYHLFAGQPLTIIGSTGPILVFETIMFSLCQSMGLTYIEFRVWVGLWTGVLCLILVATDASSLISYVTRYTEESFSALISLIFIFEAFKKLIHEGDYHQIWHGWDPDRITVYDCSCAPPADFLNTSVADENTTFNSMIQQWQEWFNQEKGVKLFGRIFKYDTSSYFCAYEKQVNGIREFNNDTLSVDLLRITNAGDTKLNFSQEPTAVNVIPWDNMTKSECLSQYCGRLVGESCEYQPDVVLMSVVLFFGTFTISMMLKACKTSRYFPTKVRSLIADFAVTIAIACMVLLDILMEINTSKLKVPERFEPTREDRGWVINPVKDNPGWSIVFAIIPALLSTILIFMDQQITAVIVNRKENKLKCAGYHLDLLVVAVMLIICSFLGLPWFVAATVLSITHVQSLRMETETSAPGERPRFLGVREQRVTGIMIFFMIGMSVFFTPILKYIPMPVLYGVFLYMGVSSLNGVQLWDRMRLFLMPTKHQPDYIYLRHVPLRKVHLFTAIQLAGLALLWGIKTYKPISITFPMMVAALVGIRKLFDYGLFTQYDLKWLDDIIPESTKRKKEEDTKASEAELNAGEQIRLSVAGVVNVPLEDGKVLSIPASEITYSPEDPQTINITKEMAQTAIWKTIAGNEIDNVNANKLRNRKKTPFPSHPPPDAVPMRTSANSKQITVPESRRRASQDFRVVVEPAADDVTASDRTSGAQPPATTATMPGLPPSSDQYQPIGQFIAAASPRRGVDLGDPDPVADPNSPSQKDTQI